MYKPLETRECMARRVVDGGCRPKGVNSDALGIIAKSPKLQLDFSTILRPNLIIAAC